MLPTCPGRLRPTSLLLSSDLSVSLGSDSRVCGWWVVLSLPRHLEGLTCPSPSSPRPRASARKPKRGRGRGLTVAHRNCVLCWAPVCRSLSPPSGFEEPERGALPRSVSSPQRAGEQLGHPGAAPQPGTRGPLSTAPAHPPVGLCPRCHRTVPAPSCSVACVTIVWAMGSPAFPHEPEEKTGHFPAIRKRWELAGAMLRRHSDPAGTSPGPKVWAASPRAPL